MVVGLSGISLIFNNLVNILREFFDILYLKYWFDFHFSLSIHAFVRPSIHNTLASSVWKEKHHYEFSLRICAYKTYEMEPMDFQRS